MAWFRRKKASGKTPRIEIREAVSSDLETIVSMLEELVGDKVPRRARARYVKTMREEQKRMLKDPTAVWLIAEREKVIVGCARATVHEQHPLLAYLEKRDYGYVFGVFVKKEERRTGTGKKLLARCEAWLRENGAKWAFLHSTIDGIPFYEALGYEPSLEFGKRL